MSYRMIQIQKYRVRILYFEKKYIINLESSSILTSEAKSPVLQFPQSLRNRFAKQTYISFGFFCSLEVILFQLFSSSRMVRLT